ncbi:hypothetical protein [Pedobacter panaciterrae]|jgi:hypothetical protein
MKVILQAALINEHYKKMWEEWFTNHIGGGSVADLDINSLIIILVADGLWYADNLGLYGINNEKKKQIVNKLLNLN